jgi:hypothetical protein
VGATAALTGIAGIAVLPERTESAGVVMPDTALVYSNDVCLLSSLMPVPYVLSVSELSVDSSGKYHSTTWLGCPFGISF